MELRSARVGSQSCDHGKNLLRIQETVPQTVPETLYYSQLRDFGRPNDVCYPQMQELDVGF